MADNAAPANDIVLKPHDEKRLLGAAGHPWVFSNEVAKPAELKDSTLVGVRSSTGAFVGMALYNPHSLIAARLITHEPLLIDRAFWRKKLTTAWMLRQNYYPQETAYRWVFGESDGIPGLIADRYGEHIVCEILSKPLETFWPEIMAAMLEVFPARSITLKHDNALRRLEGLETPPEPVTAHGEPPQGPLTVMIDGLQMQIDCQHGQKTGFYLDSRDNRALLTAYAKGRRVLDVFSYTGAFSLSLLKAGAASALAVDSSMKALETCEAQAAANGFAEKLDCLKADAEEYLQQGAGEFDLVLIDPPNICPGKKDKPMALKKLSRLIEAALRRTGKGGLTAVSVCSHHISLDETLEAAASATLRLGRAARHLATGQQAKDHPILIGMPETRYLKFILLERM